MSKAIATYTLDTYTATWDNARTGGLEAGETYAVPEDPNGTGCTVDGREIDAFRRCMRNAGLTAEYSHTEQGYDVYDLVSDRSAGGAR